MDGSVGQLVLLGFALLMFARSASLLLRGERAASRIFFLLFWGVLIAFVLTQAAALLYIEVGLMLGAVYNRRREQRSTLDALERLLRERGGNRGDGEDDELPGPSRHDLAGRGPADRP